MRVIHQYRQWLLCLALALPGVLVPQFDYMGPNRVRYSLGWPISGMDILVGGIEDGRILHFQPDLFLFVLFVAAAFWAFVIRLALQARHWAIDRSDWRGAALQSLLTCLYCTLLLWFVFGTAQVIWDWRQFGMDWPELERADRFARRWLPYFYALGACSAVAAVFVDSLRRRFIHRLIPLTCAICMCYGFWRFLHIEQQLNDLDWKIQNEQKEQVEHK